ncbi:MAG: penicillin acylase family protein [Bacteriovoracaceae bacterium]|nr:penicillin acylase family protein [Bacteriovoracaceae bacterium]
MLRQSLVTLMLLTWASWAFAQRCDLWEDSQRITHARVADEKGFAYCFGYLHGRDRAWMMDHFRRTAQGRNSEVHGFSHLKGDMMMKLLDLPAWADKLWAALGSEEKKMLEAYTAGVNHGFRVSSQQPTKEFLDDHPHPEPWIPQHSLYLLLLQSFDQTRKGFFSEWEEEKAFEKWGDKAASLYDADGVPWDTTVLKSHEYEPQTMTAQKAQKRKLFSKMWGEFPSVFGESTGSNNWVVAPSKTLNRKAMLANDPHLDLKTPMFWYWIHMEGPTTDVIGASLPGVPLVVSGANRKVSWGLTNSYINTADAVRISKEEESELISFRPLVWVKFGFIKLPIFFKSFQKTKDGFPVIPLETEKSGALVLKWSGFHLKGDDLASLRLIMQTRSAEEMERMLSRVGVPSWNFVFADINGKIGHRVVGKVFKGSQKDKVGIREGKLADVRQPEFLSPDEVPHVFNPKRGWVATANNRHWPSDSKYYGGRGYTPGFRAFRIEELLDKSKHDVDTFRSLQCDEQAVDARFLGPLIASAVGQMDLKPEEKAWLDDFKSWDFKAGLNCSSCPLYRRILDLSYEKLRVWEVGFWRLGNENNPEWLKVTQDSFKQAFGELKGKVWRDVHLNPFTHISNRKDWVYSPEIPTRGDRHSVDPGTAKWNEERGLYEHTAGASERLIVVLNDTPEIWLGLPGLNSRYDHQEGRNPWQAWADCRQERVEWPINWESKKLEKVEIEI